MTARLIPFVVAFILVFYTQYLYICLDMAPASAPNTATPPLSEITADFLIHQIEIALTLIDLSFQTSGADFESEYSTVALNAYNSALDMLSKSLLESRDKERVYDTLKLLNQRLSSASTSAIAPTK